MAFAANGSVPLLPLYLGMLTVSSKTSSAEAYADSMRHCCTVCNAVMNESLYLLSAAFEAVSSDAAFNVSPCT